MVSCDDRLLPTRELKKRYAVSDTGIDRWLANEAVGMPRPVYIGRMRYWRLSELVIWENSRRREPNSGAAA